MAVQSEGKIGHGENNGKILFRKKTMDIKCSHVMLCGYRQVQLFSKLGNFYGFITNKVDWWGVVSILG